MRLTPAQRERLGYLVLEAAAQAQRKRVEAVRPPRLVPVVVPDVGEALKEMRRLIAAPPAWMTS